MSDIKITPATKFSWAVNPVKLQQTIQALEKARTLDPSLPQLTEESVLAEYKRRAGFVLGAPETAVNTIVSKSIDKLTLNQLATLAADRGIDLSGLTKKPEVVAKLKEAGITEVSAQ